MRFRGLWPGGAFVLALFGAVLALLGREAGFLGSRSGPPEPEQWVCLTDPESGPRFRPFRSGQALGPFLEKELPGLAGLVEEGCERVLLEAGTEIRLHGKEGSREELGCTVSPLPERCRYLLGFPIDVNRAGVEDLELLAGIGPSLARGIVQSRETSGPFSSPRDLLRVPGIGKKILQRIEGQVCFD
jgi:competence ComEA-like helix-hairpin-helix protein